MIRGSTWRFIVAVLMGSSCPSWAGKGPWVPYPSQSEVDAVTAQIKTGSIDTAVPKIRAWVDGDEVPWALWHDWLPLLIADGRNQEAADVALEALATRPDTEYITHLMECRTKALANLGKPQEALEAAKGYYNVCSLDTTRDAVELAGICLATARPADLEIVRNFRAEQAAASHAQNQGDTAPGASPIGGKSILSTVRVDSSFYDSGLQDWKEKTEFADRVCYGNLLLVADRASEAEKTFRELYQIANSPENLRLAIDGIARALRAEDGNVARTNAWLTYLQNQASRAKQ